MAAPAASWYPTIAATSAGAEVCRLIPLSRVTASTAGASLSPDSASSIPDSRGGRGSLRRTENTAAASVGASTAPSSKAFRHARGSSQWDTTATTRMLTATPAVASVSAAGAAARACTQLVVRPPSARISTSAQPQGLCQRCIVKPHTQARLTERQAQAEEDQQARQADLVCDPRRHYPGDNHHRAQQQDQAGVTCRHSCLRIARPTSGADGQQSAGSAITSPMPTARSPPSQGRYPAAGRAAELPAAVKGLAPGSVTPRQVTAIRTRRVRRVPGSERLSGQGDGEVFRPPVVTPGPQFPDQLGRRHGQHRAARVRHAVTGDRAVHRIAQPAPSPVTHHQPVTRLIGQIDKRRPRRSPHYHLAHRYAAGHATERLGEGITHALDSCLLPQPQQQGAGGPQVRDLPAGRSPGQHRQQLRSG